MARQNPPGGRIDIPAADGPLLFTRPTALGWGVSVDEAVIAADPADPDVKLDMLSLG